MRCSRFFAPALALFGTVACGQATAQPRADLSAPDPGRLHVYEVAPEQVGTRADSGFIEVNGSGRVQVAPDRAVVELAVETRESEAGRASAANADLMDRVIRGLRAGSFRGLEIDTYGYTLRPEYRVAPQERTREIDGYTAVNHVRATVQDVDAVGRLIDVAIEAGANRVAGLSFQASDTEAARTRALTLAVEDATAQARTMARALGRSLGEPLEVRGGAHEPPAPGPMYDARMRMEAAVTPVEAADQTVSASVSIRFALGAPLGGR